MIWLVTVPATMAPLTFKAVRPMSISGSTEINSATSDTGRPIAGSTISAAKVAPPPTPATPAELSVTIATSSQLNVTGAAMLTTSARGGTTGVLVSATKYAAARVFQSGDTYEVGYRLSLTV